MSIGTHPNISRLPFLFIITAMIAFVIYHVASGWTLYDWLQGDLRSPMGWFKSHLFVLGWATMLAMGAVYQLIAVILNTKIYSKMLGYVQYVCFTIGLLGLFHGFVHGQISVIASFATLSFIGILLFAWNVARTMLRASAWDAITISAAFAVIYLVLTALIGMLMGLNFALGFLSSWHDRLLAAHIWLGTTGWFGLLITGFSYKLLPMFYLSHQYPVRLQYVTMILWQIGVLCGLFALLAQAPTAVISIALFIMVAALLTYNIHLLQIKKYRHKRHPGLGILWSVIISQLFALYVLCLFIFSVLYPEQLMQGTAVIATSYAVLGGWVSLTILAYASKIVPFLWWTYKYGGMVGKPGTPTMAQLLDERKVQLGLIIIIALTVLLVIALAIHAPLLIAWSGLATSLASLAYIILIATVFFQ